MSQKRLEQKAFVAPIQLIVLDNTCPLIPTSHIEASAKVAVLFQHTAAPTQSIYVKPNLEPQGILGHGRKQEILYRQKIRCTYIDSERNKDADEMLIGRFYPLLLGIHSRKELTEFLVKYPEFCIFPSQREYVGLKKKYLQTNIGNIKESRQEILLTFYLEKIEQFQDFLNKWLGKSMTEDKLLWLNQELEKASPIITGYDGSVWKRVRGVKTDSFMDSIGMGLAHKLTPLYGYRIYGYFALCCLELLHDMGSDVAAFMCKRCGILRAKNPGSKRQTCSKDQSPECVRNGSSERQKRHRKKKFMALSQE